MRVLARLIALAIGCGSVGCKPADPPSKTEPEDAKVAELEPSPRRDPDFGPPPAPTLRTSRPTGATKQAVKAIDGLEVVTFFAAGPVRDQVHGYLDELGVAVHEYDHALEPTLARELSVRDNGAIVLRAGEHTRLVRIRDHAERAERDLSRLDERVLRAVAGLVDRGAAVIVHPSGRRPRGVRDVLDAMAMTVRTREVSSEDPLPTDARIVVFIDDGTRPIGPGFARVARHIHDGGHALLALEPVASPEIAKALGPLGIELDATVLASETRFVVMRRDPSDHLALAATDFGDHPAAASLRKDPHGAVVLPGAGALTVLEDASAKPTPLVTVAQTFADHNSNQRLDAPDEAAEEHVLAMAVERGEGRILVYGDATWLDDTIGTAAPGNQKLLFDGLRWIVGDELVGAEYADDRELVSYPLRPENGDASPAKAEALWSARSEQVESIVAELGDDRVVLERPSGSSSWRGRVTNRGAGSDPEVVEFSVERSMAARLVEGLAAPEVRRSLGAVDAAKKTELGFDRGDRIQVTLVDGSTHTLLVGDETYAGANVVVQMASSEEVHIVDAKLIAALRLARRTLPSRARSRSDALAPD